MRDVSPQNPQQVSLPLIGSEGVTCPLLSQSLWPERRGSGRELGLEPITAEDRGRGWGVRGQKRNSGSELCFSCPDGFRAGVLESLAP